MARICVVHPTDLNVKGGAESVGLHILEALEDEHEVTLLTTAEPNLENLNSYFDTNVSDIKILTPSKYGRYLIDTAIGATGLDIHGIKRALVRRKAKRLEDDFDIMISSKNEIGFKSDDAIQYIHFPVQKLKKMNVSDPGSDAVSSELAPETSRNMSTLLSLYSGALRTLSGRPDTLIESHHIIVNSRWTANLIRNIYEVEPKVIYPPANASRFYDVSWGQRETGFVSVGSIQPKKNITRNIKIVNKLYQRGHDVHIHIIGPVYDNQYAKRVRQLAERYDYIKLERECSRAELIDLMCTHRYGIHGHDCERFGIAVAEMVAGGMIPFVVENGGVKEVVNNKQKLMYNSTDEAINKVDTVLNSRSNQKSIRQALPNAEKEFGKERFRKDMKHIVETVIYDD